MLSFLLAVALAGCDRGPTGAPAVAIETECTPMPAECPAQLACEVATIDQGNGEVRVCSGSACCQSFCELNGCARCCATPK